MPEATTPVETTVTEEKPVETTATETTDEKPVDEKVETEKKAEDKKPAVDPEKNHFQRRQERLLRERAEFKAEAEYLRSQMASQKQTQSPTNGRPARDQFQNDEDYVDALTTWKVDQKLSGVKQELAQHQTQSKVQTDWITKIAQAKADYSDYDTVMEDAQDIPITEAVQEAIQGSDLGGDIVYYLAKNPEEANRINSLSPMAAAREIGRIESYVEYEKDQKTKKVVPVSKAPSPIKPVKSSSGSGTKSLEDMSPAEYIAYRNKQERNK